ncbi:unnamed protein product, partial [marine sediment metagenome]
DSITYNCSLHDVCPYCYAYEQNKYFSEMPFRLLKSILNWIQELNDPIILKILGGEATEYEHFGNFLDVLYQYPIIQPTLYTNGLFGIEVLSSLVKCDSIKHIFFHYDNKYVLRKPSEKKKFENNMFKLFESGKKITLRYNTDELDFDFRELLEYATKLNADIVYSFSAPSMTNKEYINLLDYKPFLPRLEEFTRESSNISVHVCSSRPFPLCLVEPQKRNIFKNQGNIQTTCEPYPTINPDGSFLICSVLFRCKSKPVKDKTHFFKLLETCVRISEKVKWQVP